ncbi:MAG TPA: ATP-binding protein [Balneolaceae bacterium]|nr:ATP-binding protein [Balneolaceae bacterium]
MHHIEGEKLSRKCDPEQFNFETTDGITHHMTFIGQERLTTSVDFGINMPQNGYNIFALGPNETDKLGHTKRFLENKAKSDPTPPDICYVNNFEDAYKPDALILPAGKGCELEKKMDELLEDLIPSLNSTFETDEYQNRRQAVEEEQQQEQEHTFEDLQKKAQKENLSLVRTPTGFSFAPTKEGEVMKEDEIKQLSQEERNAIDEKTKEFQKELQKIIRQMPSRKRRVRENLRDLDREIATHALKELFEDIRERFSKLEEVQGFLDDVEENIANNARAILESQQQSQQQGLAQMMADGKTAQQQEQENSGEYLGSNSMLQRYRVNVLVDHSRTEGAPIIYEDNPNYNNLIGRVEYKSQMGALTTNFNMIKPGAFHKANGGYLILDARRVLLEPFAWESLKRVLKSGKLKIESLGESYRVISTVSLEPEPIDLNLKVVLLGERMLYYLLCDVDPEFGTLFKVEADFKDEIDRNDKNQGLYAQLLAGLIEKHNLKPFDKGAVARVIDHSSRLVADSEKLSAKTEEISDLLEESDYWSGKNGHDRVQHEDVQKAIDQQDYRSSRLRDRIQESINRDFIFIETEGKAIGQINGLSVSRVGHLSFGRPTKISARVRIGTGKIIDIEREVKMSGSIHSKGVLILKGFLGERYAEDRPLSLSASLVFEQSYSHIDGDSASSAELYVLLSAIGDIPIKQSISVTGSVNQHGKVQPIGGVNEKIEGFFDICKKRGLTGDQGVLIPEANEKNLMLKDEVIQAVEDKKFHIYSVSTIDEGMELLTDMEMGEKDEDGNFAENTINGQVIRALNRMTDVRKTFAALKDGNGSSETKKQQ